MAYLHIGLFLYLGKLASVMRNWTHV